MALALKQVCLAARQEKARAKAKQSGRSSSDLVLKNHKKTKRSVERIRTEPDRRKHVLRHQSGASK